MPAKSEKQRRLMQAVKHDPKVAEKTGISPSQAKRVLGEHETAGSKKPAGSYSAAGKNPGRYKKF